jgi:hypothetical protein
MDEDNQYFKKFYDQHQMIGVLYNYSIDELMPYLTESEFTKKPLYSDLQFNVNHAFKIAVNIGHLDKARFLLTSPKLKYTADIHFDDDFAIRAACEWGYKSIVDYLLHSPDLKEHAKLPENIDFVFESLQALIKECRTSLECEDYFDFIEYLIHDCNIQPTEKIVDVIRKSTPPSFQLNVLTKLAANELNLELPSKNTSISNNKNKSKI